jgi:hypothetical protein
VIPTRFGLATVVVLALLVAPCRGDLFAVMSGAQEVLRIDSATGVVKRTYPFPPFLPSLAPTPSVGMTFDGRSLYVSFNPNLQGFAELWRLDVVDNIWFPPEFMDTPPADVPKLIVGLGYRQEEYEGTLIAVSRNLTGDVPAPLSYIYSYTMFPGFPQPLFPNFPIGKLPTVSARAADVDPTTGELWIAGIDFGAENPTTRVLRTDLSGTILESVTPSLEGGFLVNGLAFDGGEMFIGARNLVEMRSEIHVIDRATGESVRSFVIDESRTIGALAGGEVIPEPSGLLLATASLGCWATNCSRRRRSRTIGQSR